MKLLIVTHYYPDHRGGIEVVAGELARRLTAKGVEIVWAASDVDSTVGAPGPAPMRAWNIAERRLGFPYPVWAPSSLGRLRSLVQWSDVVHLHDSLYLGNFLAGRMARQLGKPIVVTQHIGEVPYRSPVLRGLLRVANRTVARRVLGSCDRAVFISPRVRDYFARFVRFRTPPLYRPNGVDTQRFHPLSPAERSDCRRQRGWPVDRPTLLFVGRFVEKKGLLALCEVARQRQDCNFIFAGWGPLDPRNWGLSNVECLGSLAAPELAKCYQAADLLVLPSVGEGFPLVVQEAAACGTPALISNETAAGHEEISSFTYACQPDGASVNGALSQILGDRDELSARRERAAAFAKSQWDWDRVATEYHQLFEEVNECSVFRKPHSPVQAGPRRLA